MKRLGAAVVCIALHYSSRLLKDDHVFTSSRRSIVAECERQLHLQLMRRGVSFFFLFLFQHNNDKKLYIIIVALCRIFNDICPVAMHLTYKTHLLGKQSALITQA